MGAVAVECCPLCGSSDVGPGPIDGGVLVACRGCGIVWRGVPADSTLLDHYREGYFDDDGAYGAYFERAPQWRFEAAKRVAWLTRHASPSTLLEVGCAAGFFLEAARARGIDVRGIEPSEAASTYARDTLGLTVETGLFEEVSIDRSHEAVCAFHVLEHVQDPPAFLARAAEVVAPGGVLALEVPNIASAGAEREGQLWPNFQPSYHLWHFDPRTLASAVEAAGFAVVSVDTIMPRFYARVFQDPHGILMTIRDLRIGRSLRVVQPQRGDFVRLIARRPA